MSFGILDSGLPAELLQTQSQSRTQEIQFSMQTALQDRLFNVLASIAQNL